MILHMIIINTLETRVCPSGSDLNQKITSLPLNGSFVGTICFSYQFAPVCSGMYGTYRFTPHEQTGQRRHLYTNNACMPQCGSGGEKINKSIITSERMIIRRTYHRARKYHTKKRRYHHFPVKNRKHTIYEKKNMNHHFQVKNRNHVA